MTPMFTIRVGEALTGTGEVMNLRSSLRVTKSVGAMWVIHQLISLIANRSEVLDPTLINDHAFIRFGAALRLEGGRSLRNTNQVDWDLFRQELSNLIPTGDIAVNSETDINCLSQDITAALQQAYNVACPLK